MSDYRSTDVAGAAYLAREDADVDVDYGDADEYDDYYRGPDVLTTGGIRCAHCKARHATKADVRWCADLDAERRAEAEAEQAAEAASELAYARSREAMAERGGPDVEAEQAEAAASDWSWEYQNKWGRAENE